MKKIKALKPTTVCVDVATGLRGTITHWICNMGHSIEYIFQPMGLNPETQTPINRYPVELERLRDVPEGSFQEYDVPVEILGTQVTNKTSTYAGTAVGFVLHLHGCFHVIIQAAGSLPKTGGPITRIEADLRECDGVEIEKMRTAQEGTSQPVSPAGDLPERFVPADLSVLR